MRAITYASYGGPEVLTVTELPLPEPGPGQVRVRVEALGINPFDAKVRAGAFAGDKPFGAPKKVGRDLAGVVDAVGPEVTTLAAGHRVVASITGASAEYVLVKAAAAVPLPDGVSAVTAAGIPGAGSTAIRVLSLAGLRSGQSVLLHAAAGGVGSFTAQLARGRGIEVVGTASEGNHDYLRSIGVVPVRYGEGWQDRVRAVHPDPFDAVIDAAGRGVAEGSLPLVASGAPIVTLVDFAARGPGILATSGSEPGFENSLQEAVAAVAAGQVEVVTDQLFPLDQYAEAHRLSEGGHVRGKIIVTT